MERDVTTRIRKLVGNLSDVTTLPPLVAAQEIADMLGVSRQRVSQLAAREDFPAPAATLHVGRIWLRDDVLDWARRDGRDVGD